ncbi:MAG TPA: hypothetical protein ENI77_09650, partial [Nitrospirae bacterium]|nr:hypothetical protein [Nitrospirota bacterium]
MTFYKPVLLAGIAFFFLTSTGAHSFETSNRLSGVIDRAVSKKCVNQGKTGISVVALPSGKQVYERNGKLALLPASVQKLITTASALHYLGPNYR